MSSERDLMKEKIREVRRRFDALPPGDRARLRRSRSAGEIALEGSYWRIAEGAHRSALPGVVLLFAEAPQTRRLGITFAFGRFLKARLSSGEEGRDLRFRRVIASADRDELYHRMRGILRLASGGDAPVDWGELGLDLINFFPGEHVRRAWTEAYFAPTQIAVKPNKENS